MLFLCQALWQVFYMNNLQREDNKSAYLPVSLSAINGLAHGIAKALRARQSTKQVLYLKE